MFNFHLVLALLPLIGYLLLLGIARLLGKVIVTTGGRDIAALGIAISGMVAIGPAELFFPNAAATVFGPWVWIALITFYALIVSLVALTATPKLVVYGRTPEQLFPALTAAAEQVDEKAVSMDGLKVYLPSYGIHFRIDGYRSADHAQVVAFESGVSLKVWDKMFSHFRQEAEKTSAPAPRRGHMMILVAFALSAILLWQVISNQEQVVQGFRDWLWR